MQMPWVQFQYRTHTNTPPKTKQKPNSSALGQVVMARTGLAQPCHWRLVTGALCLGEGSPGCCTRRYTQTQSFTFDP